MQNRAEMQKEAMRAAATRYPESIIEPFNMLHDLDWFDAIYAITEAVSGERIYVPSARTIFTKCLEHAARDDYEKEMWGAKIHERLGRKYGYSERQIRRILSAK